MSTTNDNRDVQRHMMEGWVRAGYWIGVFENRDLGHPAIGQRCAFPFGEELFEAAVVDKTRAPDGRHIGLGWRYILKSKHRDVDGALAALRNEKVSA